VPRRGFFRKNSYWTQVKTGEGGRRGGKKGGLRRSLLWIACGFLSGGKVWSGGWEGERGSREEKKKKGKGEKGAMFPCCFFSLLAIWRRQPARKKRPVRGKGGRKEKRYGGGVLIYRFSFLIALASPRKNGRTGE